jgi:L-malate glycosyltransferase
VKVQARFTVELSIQLRLATVEDDAIVSSLQIRQGRFVAHHLLGRDSVPIPIALALTSFDPGGTERQVTELISRLNRQIFTVHAVCLRREGLWLDKAVASAASVAEFRLNRFASISTGRRLLEFAAWCRRHRIALVHACDFYANVFALPGAALGRVPVRIGSRRDLLLPERTNAQHALQRHAYRFAHRIVANSSAAGRQVAAEGIRHARISVIRNGIDPSAFRAAEHRTCRRVVTTVANLRAEKGHDTLIDAAAVVVRRFGDVRFQFAGDGPMRQTLERQARARGVESHIEFVGHCENVPALLAATDLFVLPSHTEAFPNSLVEAMVAGVPSIATNVGGIPELIEHNRNGLLVAPGDAAALADAVIALIEDDARARSLGRAARETILERYSYDLMIREFEELYLRELAAHGVHRLDSPAAAPALT